MALPVFGLAAEVNANAEEEDHAGEVGFGFRDGYDEVSASSEAAIDQSFSYEAVA